MPRQSDARQRMIQSAAVLFRERGVHGTTFADVLEHSGAPRGSVYHHFRGGKTQLAEEATAWAGEFVVAGAVAALAEDDPVGAIATFGREWARLLQQRDYAAGCVIAAAGVAGDREPTVRDVAGRAFAEWEEVLAGALEARDVPAARARALATLVIAAIEGALIMARAQRTTRPLEDVCAELQGVVALALAPS